ALMTILDVKVRLHKHAEHPRFFVEPRRVRINNEVADTPGKNPARLLFTNNLRISQGSVARARSIAVAAPAEIPETHIADVKPGPHRNKYYEERNYQEKD